ncbi:cytochrome c-type biogenesis protein [Aquicella lusitana]|uniref:Cytochrome c-type biogenesis protein n=1 Tax=Aquicella lusitana TaxID=254246 RepID=A0A370GAE9_9COXI|nr:cytochrome c-type biogenesis protein [Aquicella lusitana]RDI40180.1 cytochrome c-type biogenesis protein CcmH [Aquicella lusitana]VVC72429.1 Cytochrome c-type biogenesis protein CcmH [Aquicella lusitana]
MTRQLFGWAHFILVFFPLIFMLFWVNSTFAIERDPYPFTSVADAKRFESLTKEIRCVVCQNQNIADSNAPLANDLRLKVYQLVKNNKSDEEIKAYLVKRYGEFILLRPRFNLLTAILWLFPLFGIITGFYFLRRIVKLK